MPTRAVLAVLAIATLSAGCSEGKIAIELPTAVSSGASLLGTVVNVGPAPAGASPATASSGITVSVVGTSSVTSTDETGKFVLSGLPDGAVTLRFQGAGTDAVVEVTGLVNGRTITVRIRLAGSQATVQS